ncbi:MAG: cation:proton antiporter [Chitinophagales bacterium]|nr:cation:proton antiporter [Chitinophagales bacterium]
MASNSAHDFLSFLVIITVILLLGRGLGELCRKWKQPAVMGELIAGLLIGPTVLGNLFPSFFQQLFFSSTNAQLGFDGLSKIAIVLFLFVAGMEVHLSDVMKRGKAAAKISLSSILFPFAAGFSGTWLFYDHFAVGGQMNKLIAAMFMGTALSITALSVLAKILFDLDLGRSRFGSLLLTAAMINDFAGWMLFSVVISLGDLHHESLDIWQTVTLVLIFASLLLTIGRQVIDKLFEFTAVQFKGPGAALALAIIICLLGAIFTEWVGIHAIFGAFLTGVSVGDSKHFTKRAKDMLHEFVSNLLAPLFFVSIGLRVNFFKDFDLFICLFILTIAFIGKIAGGFAGARLSGFRSNKALAVGFAMNARGSMEIVLGMLAMQAGIINEKIFVGLVVMTFITILIAGPAINYFLKRHDRIYAPAV